jgi:hypothetical protein
LERDPAANLRGNSEKNGLTRFEHPLYSRTLFMNVELQGHLRLQAASRGRNRWKCRIAGARSAIASKEMRVMRTRIGWIILAAALWLAPGYARAQYQEVPPTLFTGFFSHPRYEEGGFFVYMDAVVWHMDRRIGDQAVAFRGSIDMDGSVTHLVPPAKFGSFAEALNTNQLNGPGTWTPGFDVGLGWRFESGVAVTGSWIHLSDVRYNVSAGIIPPNFAIGALQENSFLFSPVSNFSPMYAGPRDVPTSTPPNPATDPTATALYGIWNGAENMSIEILQRFDMATITGRFPLWQSDDCRIYTLFGPRAIIMYERFKWRTVDLDFAGQGTDSNNADYTNVVSQRLYGLHLGVGHEWYLGEMPHLGSLSWSLDAEASLYGDWVKARVKYEREDHATAASRARNFFHLAPGVEAKASLWWYPWEAVQVRVGYNFLALFNTLASERPIDFNMGTVNPAFDSVNRIFHGLDIGVGFVF